MKATLLAFGIAKDFFQKDREEIELRETMTVGELKADMKAQYPAFKVLSSCMIAVNNEYAKDEQLLQPGDCIALIPPVSGG